jgi:hypothetical protein
MSEDTRDRVLSGLFTDYIVAAIGRLFGDPEKLRDVIIGVVRQFRIWATNTETLVDDLLLKIMDDALSSEENWQMFLQIIGDGEVAMEEVRAVETSDLTFASQLQSQPDHMSRVSCIADRLGVDVEQVRDKFTEILHATSA